LSWNLFARLLRRHTPAAKQAHILEKTSGEKELAGILEAEEGVAETPPYSNWGKRVSEYLASTGITYPQPWCAAFVHWGMAQIGQKGYGAYCQSWFIPMHEIDAPVRNAWGLVYFPKMQRYAHIFVVTKTFGNGMIETIEGNTNNDGSREGTGVFRRLRDPRGYRFFARR
jgi:hypothetical protein